MSLQNEHEIVNAVSMTEQWPPQGLTSEEKLWQAVLLGAVFDLGNEHREEAQGWITSDVEEIGSFHWICDMLDIDPQYIRSVLRPGGRIR